MSDQHLEQSLSVSSGKTPLSEINISQLKTREVGLNLLLLGLADKQAARVSKLSSVIDTLEDEIFNPEILQHLTPQEQIQRYELATKSSMDSIDYIRKTTDTVNFDDIETKIMVLENSLGSDTSKLGEVDSTELQAAALQMLAELSNSK